MFAAVAALTAINQDSATERTYSDLFFNQDVQCRPRQKLLEVFEHVPQSSGPQLFLTKG
jgi:hypothetical protein